MPSPVFPDLLAVRPPDQTDQKTTQLNLSFNQIKNNVQDQAQNRDENRDNRLELAIKSQKEAARKSEVFSKNMNFDE